MAQAVEQSGSDAFIISDEIYRDLYYNEERPGSISEFYPRTVVISGLSKSMSMTGWRLGWILGDEGVIGAAHLLHGYVTTCASTISQKAALAAWTAHSFGDAGGARKCRRLQCRSRVHEEGGEAQVLRGAIHQRIRKVRHDEQSTGFDRGGGAGRARACG